MTCSLVLPELFILAIQNVLRVARASCEAVSRSRGIAAVSERFGVIPEAFSLSPLIPDEKHAELSLKLKGRQHLTRGLRILGFWNLRVRVSTTGARHSTPSTLDFLRHECILTRVRPQIQSSISPITIEGFLPQAADCARACFPRRFRGQPLRPYTSSPPRRIHSPQRGLSPVQTRQIALSWSGERRDGPLRHRCVVDRLSCPRRARLTSSGCRSESVSDGSESSVGSA